MNYIVADLTNIKAFRSVLPEYLADNIGTSLAAYEDDRSICGAVSFSYDGDGYLIDWIYVVPEKRLQGVGRGLVMEVKKLVSEVGICPVRIRFDASNNSGIYEFLLSLDGDDVYVDMSYSHNRYKVTAGGFTGSDAINGLNVIKDASAKVYTITSFWDMDDKEINHALTLAMDHIRIMDFDDFKKTCEKELCISAKKGDRLLAFSLVQRLPSGELNLSYLYSADQKALPLILNELAFYMMEYDKKQVIYFDAITEESELLARKIFPDATVESIYEAEV